MPIAPEALAGLGQAIQRPTYAEWSNDGGQTWQRCGLTAGSAQITADRTADVRWTAQAELVDVPTGRTGVNSLSTNVRLWEGIVLPRTDPVWFPAGRYTVSRTQRTKPGNLSVQLDGLEDDLRDASFPVARTVGPDRADALVAQLVGEALPGVPISWRPGVDGSTLIPAIAAATDRWAVLSSGQDSTGADTGIAAALAGECYIDARGVFVMAPTPSLSDPVVWRIGQGVGGVLVDTTPEDTSDGLANVWVVSGDGGDGSPSVGPVFVWDDDPNSITYAGPDPINDPGAPQRLGLTWVRARVQTYQSSVLTSVPQAYQVGQAKLANSLGVQSSLTFTTASNPASEPGDLVAVETAPGRWEKHLLDSLQRTLGTASMSCTTRTTTRRL